MAPKADAAKFVANEGSGMMMPNFTSNPSDADVIKDGGIPDQHNRFKKSLQSQIANASSGIDTVSFLRDSGMNIPRNIQLKIQEQYVSRWSYDIALMLGTLFGIGFGMFIYSVLPTSCDFSFVDKNNVIERFAFLFLGITLGVFIGHAETTGPKRCNPYSPRVRSEGKAYDPCLDNSDCTDSVDRGEIPDNKVPMCSRVGDVGKIGMVRRVMRILPGIVCIILFVTASQSMEGLGMSDSHRAIATMSGISLGMVTMIIFSPVTSVHAVDPFM